MVSWVKFFVVSVFLFLLVPVSVPWVGALGDGDAVGFVSEAEDALGVAYEAVWAAEEAGANVSDLMGRLNIAGEYLAEAHVWVRLGDLREAGRFAGLCIEVVEGFRDQAVVLRQVAYDRWMLDVIVRVIGSVFGVVVVVVAGFVGWRVFRRRYVKHVLGSRPEVASNES